MVIGEGGRDIPETEAMKHVAGYTLALDMTNRTKQNEAKKKGMFFSKQRLSCHSTAQYTSEANGPIQPAVCKSIFILHYCYINILLTSFVIFVIISSFLRGFAFHVNRYEYVMET